jgi:hypothetical protein
MEMEMENILSSKDEQAHIFLLFPAVFLAPCCIWNSLQCLLFDEDILEQITNFRYVCL